MRPLIVSAVLLSLIYFVTGIIFVGIGLLPMSTYLNYAAVFGSLASVFGLLSLVTSKKISSDDFENIEMGYLKKITEAADQLNNKKSEIDKRTQALSQTEKAIETLEIKKREMEFLVKKASLSLFLKDRLERNTARIQEIVSSNHELKGLINEHPSLKNKLSHLDEEIQNDPNVDLLSEIIEGHDLHQNALFKVKEKVNVMGLEIDVKQASTVLSKFFNS